MKQLVANLKTLYLCKQLWLPHLLLIFFYFILGTSKALANFDIIAITAFALLNYFYGLTIGTLVNDLFRKPFSYCLPGQKKSVQLMTLLIWLSMMLIFSLISGSFNDNLKNGHSFYLISIGLLSLNYWRGVASGSGRGIGGIVLFVYSSLILLPILYAMRSMLLSALDTIFLICIILCYLLYRSIKRTEKSPPSVFIIFLRLGAIIFIISSLILFPILYAMKSFDPAPMLPAAPDIFFLICIILSYYFGYRTLGRIENHHLYALTIIFREGIRFSREGKTHRIQKGFSDFFSRHILTNQNSSFMPHIWAQVYLIFGPPISSLVARTLTFGFLFLVWFAVVWFVVPKQNSILHNYIFIMLFGCIFPNHKRFNSFLLAGRRACFFRGIVNLFTSILDSLIMMTSCIIIFFIISNSLIHIKWILLISPVIAIPVIGAIGILLEKYNRGWGIGGLMVVGLAASIVMAYGLSYLWTVALKDASIYFNTTVILLAAAIAWGFHLFVLHCASMKRPLC